VTGKKGIKKAVVAFALILCLLAGMLEYLPYRPAGAVSSDPRKAYEEKLKAGQDQKKELEKQKKEINSIIWTRKTKTFFALCNKTPDLPTRN
jgi:hypothetical protein